MDIILRIYFIGLIAFVPSQNGRETTVIVERARDGHIAADGHHVPPHMPLLLARGRCEGDCRTDPRRIAEFLFELPGQPNTRASLRQLDSALEGGGAWILDDVELVFDIPTAADSPRQPLAYEWPPAADGPPEQAKAALPADENEARNFGWIASMRVLAPAAATIHPRVLAGDPSLGLVAARLVIDQGALLTNRLVEIDGVVAPLAFQPVSLHMPVMLPRAFAQWITLDIPLSQAACRKSIGVTARPLGSGQTLTMKVTPECTPGSTVEMAIVNLPSWQAAHRSTITHPSSHGSHFELFYKLAESLPACADRPVLALAEREKTVEARAVATQGPRSPLLDDLHLLPPKGVFAQPICVPVAFDPPSR